MENEKIGIPKLRFPGYTDAWEERKLGDEFKKVSERNDGSFGRNHWISVAKMYFQRPEKVQSNNIDTRTYVMREGDIAFEGHPNSEFKFGRFVANDIGAGVVSELFPIYRHQHEYDNNYWKNAIQIERTMAPIFAKSITSSGNSSNKLDTKHFLRQKILIPQINEQKKIGSFFKQLDDTIALHQRKLDDLKKRKSGLLQKMFPRDGEDVPELRFPGYTDAWEQRNFGELYKKNLERNKDQFSSDRTISIATMRFKKEGNGAAEDSLVSYKVLREGDIAFEGHTSKRFAFGRFVLNDIGDGIMSPRFTTLRPTQDMPIKFWKQYIHYEPIMRYPIVNSTKLGTMMNELVVDEFLNQPVLVPELSEQQKIGIFFNKLDDNIALHQRQLDHLKLRKKALLQQMFV